MTMADDQDFRRDHYLARGEDLDPEMFPLLDNLSLAFIFKVILRPARTSTPEFIYIDSETASPAEIGDIITWNMAWEAGHLRRDMFCEKQLVHRAALGRAKRQRANRPDLIERIERLGIPEDSNIYMLPFNKKHHYHSYSALFHLIPQKNLKFNKLPLLKRGIWPVGWFKDGLDDLLPSGFDEKLARAFSFHVWPLIDPGSKALSFSENDSLRILSHNLDFWLPSIFKVVENRLSQFSRVAIESEDQVRKLEELRLLVPPSVEAVRPLCGGFVWAGEDDAWAATKEMVELADSGGNLRGMIDAIRSNRVEDDFSDVWSYAREDFERKLYRKRSKTKIAFVELRDTLPVHGPDSEFHENLLWEDFFGILDQKEKRIVVCLRNGTTNLGDIAKEMGYANHSPVSKALKKIREKAKKFLID